MATDILLETKRISKFFTKRRTLFQRAPGTVRAVDSVSLAIRRRETLGLVGESGCGKSTLGRTILRLIPATGGQVFYDSVDVTALENEALRQMKRRMQIVFQDPYGSLNPRMTVQDLVRAPLEVFQIGERAERDQRVLEILNKVGLGPQHARRYPHEFSGGQRQRIGIARALVMNPEFVVCDEPVSALDVSVRAQVLNLMGRLQADLGLTYLFISHDLSVVRHISDRVAVMYLGRIVETADKQELYSHPLHPYTQALMAAIPIPDVAARRKRTPLAGDVPSAYNPPSGCHFHPRCPYATARCSAETPTLTDVGNGHTVACHLVGAGEATYAE